MSQINSLSEETNENNLFFSPLAIYEYDLANCLKKKQTGNNLMNGLGKKVTWWDVQEN